MGRHFSKVGATVILGPSNKKVRDPGPGPPVPTPMRSDTGHVTKIPNFINSRCWTNAILKMVLSPYITWETSIFNEIWCSDADSRSKNDHVTKYQNLQIQNGGRPPYWKHGRRRRYGRHGSCRTTFERGTARQGFAVPYFSKKITNISVI